MLVGNKIDKNQCREVSSAEALKWCQKNNNIPYEETSAKENQNIDLVFHKIAVNTLAKNVDNQDISPPKVVVSLIPSPVKNGCFC